MIAGALFAIVAAVVPIVALAGLATICGVDAGNDAVEDLAALVLITGPGGASRTDVDLGGCARIESIRQEGDLTGRSRRPSAWEGRWTKARRP